MFLKNLYYFYINFLFSDGLPPEVLLFKFELKNRVKFEIKHIHLTTDHAHKGFLSPPISIWVIEKIILPSLYASTIIILLLVLVLIFIHLKSFEKANHYTAWICSSVRNKTSLLESSHHLFKVSSEGCVSCKNIILLLLILPLTNSNILLMMMIGVHLQYLTGRLICPPFFKKGFNHFIDG